MEGDVRFKGRSKILVWAPYRIDAGGTWDIKALALPFQSKGPVTLNMALDMGVIVEITAHAPGIVQIQTPYYATLEGPLESISFSGPLGLFGICLAHLGVDGISIRIRPSLPPGSALGGSSSALVALLVGLRELVGLGMDDTSLVTLAYHIEDIHQLGGAGMQDHLAAMFGGVNLWKWNYSSFPFFQRITLKEGVVGELKERVVVFHLGTSHFSPGLNRTFVSKFMEGSHRGLWIEANEVVKSLWQAINNQDWEGAAGLLSQETALRERTTKDAFKDPFVEAMIKAAEEVGCGARFTGAGGGGCLWAIGEKDRIAHLRTKWGDMASKREGASLLKTQVTEKGAAVLRD